MEPLELELNRRLADAMQRRVNAMYAAEWSKILHGDPTVPTPQGITYVDDDDSDDEDTPIIVEG